jgi:hypothetical protein
MADSQRSHDPTAGTNERIAYEFLSILATGLTGGAQEAGSAIPHAASKFALTAEEYAFDHDSDKAVAALTTLVQTCVSCHAVYR